MAAGPEVMVLNEQFFDNSVSNETQIDELLQFVEPRLVAKVKSSFFFVIAVVSICVGTLGISGNTLSIFVLSTKDLKKSPASGMLRWLAVWDSITIVSLVFFMDYVNVVWFHATENGKIFTYWFPLIHKVSDPLFATGAYISDLFIVVQTYVKSLKLTQVPEKTPANTSCFAEQIFLFVTCSYDGIRFYDTAAHLGTVPGRVYSIMCSVTEFLSLI